MQTQTLRSTLEALIERHGFVEVLDRLADISQTRPIANASQITKLLEEAIELSLANHPPT